MGHIFIFSDSASDINIIVQHSLAVLPAGGFHIILIFGKDLKSTQFHSLKNSRRFEIEV